MMHGNMKFDDEVAEKENYAPKNVAAALLVI